MQINRSLYSYDGNLLNCSQCVPNVGKFTESNIG